MDTQPAAAELMTTIEARSRLGLQGGYGTDLLELPHTKGPKQGRESGALGRRPNLYRRADIELVRELVLGADISFAAAVRVVAALRAGKLSLFESEGATAPLGGQNLSSPDGRDRVPPNISQRQIENPGPAAGAVLR